MNHAMPNAHDRRGSEPLAQIRQDALHATTERRGIHRPGVGFGGSAIRSHQHRPWGTDTLDPPAE